MMHPDRDRCPDIFRSGLLAGKNAFITGGGSGINLTIAERFASQGAKVALMGRTHATLDKAVEGIRGAGGEAFGIAGDVRDYEALAVALAHARNTWGPLDILVCGAAGNFPAPATGMSANGFKAVVDIDLLGSFNTCRAAWEHLAKPGASVLCISSIHAFTPIPWQSHVCAAKAGVDMLAKTLAIEWGPAGVRVNVISPGPVDDTEGMRRLAPTEEHRRQVAAAVPLGRFASRSEIADLALFLCSGAANYITGAVLVCDGGQSLTGGAGIGGLAEPRP